jgi:Zn-dependent peptidase ImmA (M78 family)
VTAAWVERAARDFWASAGGPEPFPRDLERAVLWALPLAVLKLPRLSVSDVEAWMERRGIPYRLNCSNRRLRGCLIAYADRGCILLDGTDTPDELRFSMAHEAAHFLLDYLEPRRRAIERLGETVLEVFDGCRPPTIDERVDGLLSATTIGVHTHLMARGPDGDLGCGDTAGVEHRADQLAIELLAPATEIHRRIRKSIRPASFRAAVESTIKVLVEDFGLPPVVADRYGRRLARKRYGGPSFREWIGL